MRWDETDMVSLLIVDALWRMRWVYVGSTAVLILCWLMYSAGGSDVFEFRMASLSLVIGGVLGPMFALAAMSLRELRHLPVTTRDLWRATWILATVVSVVLLLATKTIAVILVTVYGATSALTAEAILVSAAYDFGWAGTVLPMVASLVHAAHMSERRGRLASELAVIWAIAVLLACFGLPRLVSRALPMRVADFTPWTTAALMVCLTIAVRAREWTPRPDALITGRAQPEEEAPSRRTAQLRRMVGRLTGLPRVAVPYLSSTFALAVGAGLAMGTAGRMSGLPFWWFVPQAADLFDPSQTGDRGLTYLVLMPCGIVAMQGPWAPWARMMKTLPLSVRQVNAVVLFTPLATWAIFWVLGVSAYVVAHGLPGTLRVDFAFGMAAFCALAHAVLLRFQGSTAIVLVLALIGGLMPSLVKAGLRGGIVEQIVFVVLGTIALGIAAFVNHRTLTRSTSSSSAYRRAQSRFDKFAAPGMR